MHTIFQEVLQAAAADASYKSSLALGKSVVVMPSLVALKGQVGNTDSIMLLAGKTSLSDGLGGFYYWDAASTETGESEFPLNVVAPNPGLQVPATGRWKRINAKVTVLAQGVLVANAGVKTLYAAAAVAGSAGQATLNLTADNTATGPALFTEIWANQSSVKPPMAAATLEDTILCEVLSEASNLKQTVHVAVRGNKTTLPTVATSLLGLVVTPLRYAPAGTLLRITITGI